MKKIIFFLIVTILVITEGQAQTKVPVLTADSLSSGNYKDIFLSFYQLAINNLSGPNKEFKFTTNPYAIALKNNPKLLQDVNYQKYTALRRLNFNVDVKVDSTSKFSGGSFGLKYAIIDRRDYTVANNFADLISEKFEMEEDFYDAVVDSINKIGSDSIKKKFNSELRSIFSDTVNTKSNLSQEFVGLIRFIQTRKSYPEIKDWLDFGDASFRNYVLIRKYQEIIETFQNKPLLTFSADLRSYDDEFQISDVENTLQFLYGFISPKEKFNLEMDLKAKISSSDNKEKIERDLHRNIFSFEPGINWVLKGWGNGASLLEFKLGGSYNYIISGQYKGEKKETNTLNGTLQLRITQNIRVPIELKYDPESGNVFGFINVKADFTMLKNELKSLNLF